MLMRTASLAVGFLLVAACQVRANLVTYYVAGTVRNVSSDGLLPGTDHFGPIIAGTPFDGTFTIDTSVAGQRGGFYTYYPQTSLFSISRCTYSG
jgi:hypothetical protein